MNKKQILLILEKQNKELVDLITKLEKSHINKIEGLLVCRKKSGKPQFERQNPDLTETYLGVDMHKTISELATKRYALKLKHAAEKEKRQIEKCISALKTSVNEDGADRADIDLVYETLPAEIKPYVVTSLATDDGYARKWQEQKYLSKALKGDYKFKTKRGEIVRSKSELIIANMLADAGIPYRYEPTHALSEEYLVIHNPDFMILNKRTREVFIWEHLGMMDDEEYRTNALKKISVYMRFGYFSGKNLILTFEDGKYPLNTDDIAALIKEHLM